MDFEKEGMTPIFDLDAAVIKSDTAIPSPLAEELKVACQPLENVPPRLKDWHPGSDGKVLDLVHPSLFPLVYGTSKVLPSGHVPLKECVEYIGKGETIKIPDESEVKSGSTYAGNYHFRGGKGPNFWSKDFQWLPCQVEFGDGEEVEITSYINNLHPMEFSNLYSVLEQCITKSIPLWERTLSSTKQSRAPRIDMKMTQYEYPQGREMPEDYMSEQLEDDESGWQRDSERREQWEHTTRVLIKPEPKEYAPLEQSADGQIDLRSQFKDRGLQIIVKLANIELSPEKPDYEGGSWHIEGQMNERICASALYYYDSKNITESFLAFRHRVDDELEMKAYGQVRDSPRCSKSSLTIHMYCRK